LRQGPPLPVAHLLLLAENNTQPARNDFHEGLRLGAFGKQRLGITKGRQPRASTSTVWVVCGKLSQIALEGNADLQDIAA
jgi:hypothetical protein